jgi:hypothetical protein
MAVFSNARVAERNATVQATFVPEVGNEQTSFPRNEAPLA